MYSLRIVRMSLMRFSLYKNHGSMAVSSWSLLTEYPLSRATASAWIRCRHGAFVLNKDLV